MGSATLTGRLPAELANQVSAAIAAALERGAETDEACCVAVQVAADYWRRRYGEGTLETLSKVLLRRAQMPLPDVPSALQATAEAVQTQAIRDRTLQ
jgi:hypothetical protein